MMVLHMKMMVLYEKKLEFYMKKIKLHKTMHWLMSQTDQDYIQGIQALKTKNNYC